MLKKFFTDIMQNDELKAKYEALGKSLPENASKEEKYAALINFAKENGYEISKEELEESVKESSEVTTLRTGKYDCACIVGGGGPGESQADPKRKTCATCACVLGGVGMYWNDGTRCACPLAGGGVS
ncbi:Nif11-like leader peptide family natural product precursor [uncultured Megamonas sp.]|uniref:Nif11-like leader peptide family natural product precursor n=1 Tax=uncultured Megamonas sp. TaxID=286140 RepID=UPI0025988D62|nr:Nif11-like leader peptide family natural product precursor [uncultured Megamonas sp.]